MSALDAPGHPAAPASPRLIKCLVWDLDETLWAGVQAEGAQPQPRPAALALMDELSRRGIVQSVASRNDPAAGARLLALPVLAGRFVAPQVGWEPKDVALRRIAKELNIGLDSLAFVDDSPFERAAVAAVLPEVLVLAPEDLPALAARPEFAGGPGTAEAAARTRLYQEEASRRAAERDFAGDRARFLESCAMVLAPEDLPALAARPEFAGGPGTAEAAARTRLYQEEAARRAAERDFAGDRARFLESCAMVLEVRPATPADLPRLDELVARTNQLNSTGYRYPPEETARRVHDPRYLVPVARLRDRFGDYGLIGAALVDRAADGAWLVELLMLSCRVEGRGIPGALLRLLLGLAGAAGVPALDALYRANPQNRQMAILLRSLSFHATAAPSPPGPATAGATVYRRPTDPPLPAYPAWLTIDAQGLGEAR